MPATLAHPGANRQPPGSADQQLDHGAAEIQHLTGCGAAWKESTHQEMDQLIDVMLEHQVVMTPTLVVWDRIGRVNDHSFDFDIRRRWVHPCHRDIWDHWLGRTQAPHSRLGLQAAMPNLKRCLARMHERGLAIALGTDLPVAGVDETGSRAL